MSSEDYCLKWNDHHSVFFSSVERLCNVDVLTDVTLSCGARTFSAHKLVLSVCSGYFAGLFANQARDARAGRLPPDYRHAIVYLKDVDPRHMELLLTYMYRGEINVQEHELMSFLAAAKSLQIKGLADGGSNDGNSQQQNKSKPPTPISLPTRPLPMAQAKKRPLILAPGAGGESAAAKMMKDEMEENNGEGTSQNDDGAFSGDQLDDDDIDDDLTGEEGAVNPAELYEGGDIEGASGNGSSSIKAELNDSLPNTSSTSSSLNLSSSLSLTPAARLPTMPMPMVPLVPGLVDSFNKPKKMDRTNCTVCGQELLASSMARHMLVHTGQKPFGCSLCNYRSSEKSKVRRHLKIHGGEGDIVENF